MKLTRQRVLERFKEEQLCRMTNFYKAMLDKRKKQWVRQKTLDMGTMLIEWQFCDSMEPDFIYLCPNDGLKNE